MEPESGSKRTADQLQGVAIQDQAVRPRSKTESLNHFPPQEASDDPYLIVIRGEDYTIKGYADRSQWPSDMDGVHAQGLSSIRLKHLQSGEVEDIPLTNVKAVFFVKDFSGQTSHVDLLFHDRLPPMECLWIRIRFEDGETVEGIIHNALDYIVGPGFFMAPADPIGNNWLIYVSKSKLTGFEILGLRPRVKSLHRARSAS
jgi:hypothetical protein